MKKTALEYLQNHLCALPADKEMKRPDLGRWKEFQSRLPTSDDWKLWCANAICIITGAVSGNLLLIDFDQQGKVFEDFKKKIPEHLFNRCVIEQSQSGGFHLIVRAESKVGKNQKLAHDAAGKVLIETRGEGGLFLCAPTEGYTLIQNDFATIPVLSDMEMEFLLETARSFNQYHIGSQNSLPKRETSFLPERSEQAGQRPGDDFNERGRELIRALLEKHGWSFVKQDGVNEHWRRPGKAAGQSASLHSEMPVFYVFSSNAVPFEANQGYSFFEVYTMLEHGGDHTAAAKQLAEEGYGDVLPDAPVELPEFITRAPEPVVSETKKKSTKNDRSAESDEFPKHLLNVPGFVNELSKFINETSFVPQPVLALAASLVMQALLCSQQVKDPLGTRPNINILAVGRSSSGKERGRKVIKEILSTLGAIPGKRYDANRLFFEDTASHQAIIKTLGRSNGMLIWLWDEIGKILPTLKNDKSGNLSGILPVIMRLYTSSDSIFIPNIRADTTKELSLIHQPHLILYGTSVPRNLFESFSVESLTDGLIGRLLIFEGDDNAEERDDLQHVSAVPQPILDTADWWLTKRMDVIHPTIPSPKEVPVTPKAVAIFKELQQIKRQARKGDDDVELALWGRSVEQARQLALIYAASQNREEPTIDADAAGWATELVSYLIQRKLILAELYMADDDFEKKQKKVLQFIRSCQGKCTKTMMTQKFKNWRPEDRERIFKNLTETESVVLQWQETTGRRVCNIVINEE